MGPWHPALASLWAQAQPEALSTGAAPPRLPYHELVGVWAWGSDPSLSRASRHQNFYGNPRDFEMLLHISKKHHMSQIKHGPHWPPVLTRGRGRSVLCALVGAVLLGPLQGGALCSCLGAWFPSHRTNRWAPVPSRPALYWPPAEGREVRQLSAHDLGCHLLGSSPCQASARCCQAAASSLAGRGGVPPSGALCPAAARRGW